ncbi:hypothetical protein K3495_g5272 [Podosphaera aphanis]|nr:hypothetical protein K3495_g5272 [Podosphaera aphanis]
MQPLNYRHDCLPISLGERRKKSDLGSFSLDLSWTRETPDIVRTRAYPSPPMSGSPPLPPRLNLDLNDRGHGHAGYISGGGSGCGYRDLPTPQHEHFDHRGLPQRSYPQPPDPAMSMTLPGPYRSEHMPPLQGLPGGLQPISQISQTHHQPHSDYLTQSTRPLVSFSTSGPSPVREQSGFSSPKQQRKTKGHVASACVPCKRAHLR